LNGSAKKLEQKKEALSVKKNGFKELISSNSISFFSLIAFFLIWEGGQLWSDKLTEKVMNISQS